MGQRQHGCEYSCGRWVQAELENQVHCLLVTGMGPVIQSLCALVSPSVKQGWYYSPL